MAPTIRTATQSDLAAVDALLARSYPLLLKADYPPSVLVTALPRISRANPLLLRSGSYYVAELDDCIVGAGGWTRDKTHRSRGHVRHFGTDKDHLRQGIGRMLMRHVILQAGLAGVRELECWSTRTAVAFYTAMGFHETGPIEVDLAPGIVFPTVRMAMRLPT